MDSDEYYDDCDDFDESECEEIEEEYDEEITTNNSIALIAMCIGFVCIIVGVLLSINEISGGFINWNFNAGNIGSSISNATPGVLLMIIGFGIIIIAICKRHQS